MPSPVHASPSFRLLWPVLLMGALMLASHLQVPPAVPSFEWFEFDKLAHLLLYGLLATLWLRALTKPGGPPTRRPVLLAFGLTVGFGMVDEVIQSFNVYRVFSLADWVADLLGASLALASYTALPFYRRTLERSLGFPPFNSKPR